MLWEDAARKQQLSNRRTLAPNQEMQYKPFETPLIAFGNMGLLIELLPL